MTERRAGHADHYALRDEIVESLRKDLLGPAGGEDDILKDDAPITAYPIGVLFPRQVDKETEREKRAEDDGQDEAPLVRRDGEESVQDAAVSLANERRPSSMGITFAVDPSVAPTLTVRVSAAAYEPQDEHGNPVEARRSEARSTGEQRERWRRRALEPFTVPLELSAAGASKKVELREGLELRTLVRRPGPQGTVTVTVTLVNSHRIGKYDLQDAHCFFQPVVEVLAPDGSKPFVERPALHGAVDEEQGLSRLLHRHVPSFATGHGCAAVWDWDPPAVGEAVTGPLAVSSVRTEFVPTHEVLLTDSNPDIDDRALTMDGLATGAHTEVMDALRGLLTGYEAWIEAREAEIATLAGTGHEGTAHEQVRLCRQALGRMRGGVDRLDRDPVAMEAFRAANAAMAQQRARTAWVKGGKKGEPQVEDGRWRPFQIAFFLLCLDGIVDPNHDDRRVADLLWFPTGGGKTEAYLGLIAFTVFLRRLRKGAAGGGVTVLMRYTLRLLTLQQFERAAALICAMENRRRIEPERLGHEPISIGMWVGASATPNNLDDAADSLKALREGKTLQEKNPVQLRACPWCGTEMDAANYRVEKSLTRMIVSCPGKECDFGDGLPVHLVDDAVYDARPTLLIATVDKFASMPWRPQTAALFNRDRGVPEGTPPPELVVQDELHLISGPLGTLTGLYETAVDFLAEAPKVIASTATIRRAGKQGRALFDRQVQQFPPSGLDARDSWFAVETPRERKAARRYVGLLTPSTSQATLLVRAYAALLHHAARIEADDEVRDAYWTLVGYFNSLRLLAAAELQVLDDVQDRLDFLTHRDGIEEGRRVRELSELTSRADASEVPRRLKLMERALPDEETLDVLLATNMISVGVDVDRLGLMAVMGQPQTTAEYIQSTSRVGRRHPGLVVALLNAARSRDRSHYENFLHFHSALYREVESTSVTPFSARARDRGLHAVVVALARILIDKARPNDGAAHISEFEEELRAQLRVPLLARVGGIEEEERAATEEAFDDFVDWWSETAAENPELVYEAKRGTHQPALLSAFGAEATENSGWDTLWSLRDVDAESALFLEP
ncbi:helicase-related protein [Streptomyces sp. NPDC059506]|uniref:helicase-related protein n=1 Tax=Streptomyces sp. NPDC059506 TaxID=3347751 RepID=UPI003686A375